MMKILVALLALVAGAALAQAVPPSASGPVSYPVSTIRNISTLGPYRVDPSNVARHAFAHATSGLVETQAQGIVPLGGGRNLPVVVRSQIPKATATAAIGRFALKSLPLLSAGVALYDLGEELGFGLDNSSGTVAVTKPVVNIGCDAYPQRPNFTACGSMWPTPDLPVKLVRTNDVGQRICYQEDYCTGGSGYTERWDDGLAAPETTTDEDSHLGEFIDALNAREYFPPQSAYARVLRDAINSGELVPVHPSEVTGPVTSPGPVTTTTDTVANTTTTATTTHHHTYDGPNVTTTTTTTTTTIDNITNNIISNTTTTTEPVMPENDPADDTSTATDTPFPEIGKLYEPEFPEGLEGVWNARKAQLLDTSLFQIIPALLPNVGDGGCPAWSIPSIYGGNLNASIPCNVWYFIRLVIIISALLLARRLIFGG